MHTTLLPCLSRRRKNFTFTKFFFSTTTTSSISNSNHNNTNIISRYFFLLNTSPNPTHLRHLHARLLRTSLYSNVILSSKLILMYSRHSKLIPHSLSVFFHMPFRNIYSWNIIIGEFSRSNSPQMSLFLFLRMWSESHEKPDHFSYPLVFRAAAASGCAEFGVSVHGLCVKLGWDVSLFVASALVFMYVTFGRVLDARVLFDEMPERDAVLWTAMLAGYAQHGEPLLGLRVFREMSSVGGIELDGAVMVSLLLVCGQLGWLREGKSVHGWSVRNCSGFQLSLGNAIVDMYVKCGMLVYAHRFFDKMLEKDVLSWSSLIWGYGLIGNVDAALGLFDRMHGVRIKPNNVTFLGVLSACAHGGLVEQARCYFKLMQDYGLVPELKHYASMADCLGRAGLLEEAYEFVEDMPMEPDEAVLGAILAGCRVHNNVEVGEQIAKKLIRLKPDKAGYYVLLSNMYAGASRYDEAEIVRSLMKEENVCKAPGCSLIESNKSKHYVDV